MNQESAVAYLENLVEGGQYSPKTLYQARCALKILLQDVLQVEFLKLKEVSLPQKERVERRCLEVGEVQDILAELTNLHQVAMMLMVGSGARVEECMALQRKHVLLDDEMLILPARGRIPERTAPIDQRFLDEVERYLCIWGKEVYRQRGWLSHEERGELYLFPTSYLRGGTLFGDKPLRSRTFQRLFREAADRALGVDHGVTPDFLRWTFAVTMYREGNVDLDELQMILGHQKIETTHSYLFLDGLVGVLRPGGCTADNLTS